MSARHTCANCAHNGCCADLHHCGGACWEPDEGDGEEREERDPWEGYDPRDQLEHDAEAWQEMMDRKY